MNKLNILNKLSNPSDTSDLSHLIISNVCYDFENFKSNFNSSNPMILSKFIGTCGAFKTFKSTHFKIFSKSTGFSNQCGYGNTTYLIRFNRKLLFIIFSLFFISRFLFAQDRVDKNKWQCDPNAKIKWLEKSKTYTQPAGFCVNQNKNIFLAIQCQNQNCPEIENPMVFTFKELSSPVGNPSFKLCRNLGGHPRLVTYISQKLNINTYSDQCLWPSGAFTSTDYLIKKNIIR